MSSVINILIAPQYAKRRLYSLAIMAMLLAVLLAPLISRSARLAPRVNEKAPLIGQWVYLSELEWATASTGWLAVANSDQPQKDAAFSRKPLVMAGQRFEKGIGAYPLSQIVYTLNAEYQIFEAYIGLNDDSNLGEGQVRFLVFVDNVRVYESGPMRQGDPAQLAHLPIYGANQLRLVTEASDNAGTAFTNWADAKLLRPVISIDEETQQAMRRELDNLIVVQESGRQRDRVRARAEANEMMSALQPLVNGYYGRATSSLDAERGRLLMLNNDLGVSFGFGGDQHSLLSVLQRDTGRIVIYQGAPAIETPEGERIDLHRDTVPEDFVVREIVDPALGKGQEVEIILLTTNDYPWRIQVNLSLFDSQPSMLIRLLVNSADGSTVPALRFFFLQGKTQNVLVGRDLEYVTDFSRVRHSLAPDDGLLYREAIGFGKPLYLWSRSAGQGLLLAMLDETTAPARFSLQTDQGLVRSRLSVSVGELPPNPIHTAAASPALYIEPIQGKGVRDSFKNYRRLMSLRHPSLGLPEWVRYQWLSWYVYYMDISDAELRRQVDYIAGNLGDLGPWHIIVDAGWYVAEGKEGADWRTVDKNKFPDGLRAFVDYAHSKGVRVVLYFSAPYLDSRQRRGDWLGLRNIIEKHPDWLVPLGEDRDRQSYVYDFTNPDLRQYLTEVMKDYFIRYDVDGIKLDGLGNAEGALLDPEALDGFGLVERAAGQTMDIYQFVHQTATSFKPDAYIESGWMAPLFANRYCHTFRYGDERPEFNGDYPFPGLSEHIDYAVLQKEMLGQHANMGAIIENPGDPQINQWWIDAALALDTQISISIDLTSLSPEMLSTYRARLVHYNPFKGVTHVSSFFKPEIFATNRDSVTFLGVLNRTHQDKDYDIVLADYGLQPNTTYLAYNVEDSTGIIARGRLKTSVPSMSHRLFVLRQHPGVVWTNSSFNTRTEGNSLFIAPGGPKSIEGQMLIYAPKLKAVWMDGQLLRRSRRLVASTGMYTYENATGMLRLWYDHNTPHQIRVDYTAE